MRRAALSRSGSVGAPPRRPPLTFLSSLPPPLARALVSAEHESTTLYRLSPSLALDLLRAKVDALAQVDGGIFGPLESTQLGEEAKPAPVAEPVVESEKGEAAAGEAGPQAAQRYSTVSRGLAKEGAGSGHGLSEQLQIGACFSLLVRLLSSSSES